MSLIDGEGRVEILYGMSPLPIPPNRDLYLARPDVAGAHPVVVVVPGDRGVTPSVKALCRRISRYGYAALAPELFRGGPPRSLDDVPVARVDGDLADLLAATRDQWSHWCASDRFVALGLGSGVAAAVRLAGLPGGSAVISPTSLDGLGETLEANPAPLLALVGGRSAVDVLAVRATIGRGEWIVYGAAGPGFLDDGSDEYHRGSAEDAFDRLIAFLDGRLTRQET